MVYSTAETSVCLYYDNADVLIYVGITQRGPTRNSEHNKLRHWWQYVARQEVEHFPTRATALLREAKLIRQFTPPFNVQHNPHHREMRHAYELFAAGGGGAQDPKVLLKSLGGKIPLHFLSEDSYNRRIFRSELAHASIGFRLQEFKEAGLFDSNGVRIGRVTEACRRGPLVLIHMQPSRGLVLDYGFAVGIVKQLCVKGPIKFALRHVRFDGVRHFRQVR